MARGLSTRAELVQVVERLAKLERSHESQKRRQREVRSDIDVAFARIALLERWQDSPYRTNPLPTTDSIAPPPATADSGALRFPAWRFFLLRLFGRIPR